MEAIHHNQLTQLIGREISHRLSGLARKSHTPTTILTTSARAHHEVESYGLVSRTYSRLKSLDPDLAGQFAYLDFRGEEARRAAEVSDMASRVIWDEE